MARFRASALAPASLPSRSARISSAVERQRLSKGSRRVHGDVSLMARGGWAPGPGLDLICDGCDLRRWTLPVGRKVRATDQRISAGVAT